MPKPKDTLDRLNVSTPCTADWDEMVGNDEVRFCRHCDLSVHNLSAMTRQDALRLVISSKGKLCARYIRRPDGAIRTTDLVLPQLHSIKRHASRFVVGAFSAALSVSTSVVAASPAPSRATAKSQADSTLLAHRASSFLLATSCASVKGIVRDSEGGVIPGARVTLINDASGFERITTTDGEGYFLVENLEEGTFTLKIEASRFIVKERTNITVGASGEQTFDETLNVDGEFETMGGISLPSPSDPLIAAVFDGDIITVKQLLANGADVDSVDEGYDSTALNQAVLTGSRELVDILINAGADVNRRNRAGQTALMAMNGAATEDIVWSLIDAGAKTDLRDDIGKNALHYAAATASPEILRALLNGGASVDVRDKEDQTALMIAATIGNTKNVEVLLKAGASVNLRDEDGATALGHANEGDHTEVIKTLEAYGGTE